MIGELALEHREHEIRDAVARDGAVDAPEVHEARIPAEPATQDVRAEGQRVPDHDPDHADDGHRGEAVHHRAQDVLRPDEPAVEHGQAGDHQQHQGRRGEHPGGGARIDGRLRRQRGGSGRLEPDHDRDAQDGQQRRHRHDDLVPGRWLGAKHPRSPSLARPGHRAPPRGAAASASGAARGGAHPRHAREPSQPCRERVGYGLLRLGVECRTVRGHVVGRGPLGARRPAAWHRASGLAWPPLDWCRSARAVHPTSKAPQATLEGPSTLREVVGATGFEPATP